MCKGKEKLISNVETYTTTKMNGGLTKLFPPYAIYFHVSKIVFLMTISEEIQHTIQHATTMIVYVPDEFLYHVLKALNPQLDATSKSYVMDG